MHACAHVCVCVSVCLCVCVCALTYTHWCLPRYVHASLCTILSVVRGIVKVSTVQFFVNLSGRWPFG